MYILYLLYVPKQQTCTKCSYSASNQFCIVHTCLCKKIVAVHSQNSKPHAVLAVHCNYYVHVVLIPFNAAQCIFTVHCFVSHVFKEWKAISIHVYVNTIG